MRDPYKALGVDKKATDAEIKKAYRRLAKEYHPDRHGGDKAKEDRFKDISAAYNILSDPNKRAQFDNAAQGGGIPMGDLSDIFAQMFGGQVRTQGFGGGSPFSGMGGMGMGGNPFGGMGGMGGPFAGSGQAQRRRPAPKPKSPPKERKIKASDGSELTLRGVHLYSDLRVSFDKAMTGTVAQVPTRSGSAKVKIPAGSNSGIKLRLKGKGMRSSSGKVGDHFVTVHIDVPKVETEEGREALQSLLKSLSKEK